MNKNSSQPKVVTKKNLPRDYIKAIAYTIVYYTERLETLAGLISQNESVPSMDKLGLRLESIEFCQITTQLNKIHSAGLVDKETWLYALDLFLQSLETQDRDSLLKLRKRTWILFETCLLVSAETKNPKNWNSRKYSQIMNESSVNLLMMKMFLEKRVFNKNQNKAKPKALDNIESFLRQVEDLC